MPQTSDMPQGFNNYLTGADVDVYLTEGNTPPDLDKDEPLDVASLSFIEEGQVIPLFDYHRSLTKHFAYTTRMVSGRLRFNFTSSYVRNYRHEPNDRETNRRPMGHMRGHTLWLVLNHVEWWPEVRVVRDMIRLSHVWEHPFSHSAEGLIQEDVPFSARDMQLVRRTSQTFDQALMNEALASDDPIRLLDASVMRGREEMEMARVLPEGDDGRDGIVDGDTIDVEIEATGEVQRIRFLTFNTAEDHRNIGADINEYDGNVPGEEWRWPSGAESSDRGQANTIPPTLELNRWGVYATDTLKRILPPGSRCMVIRDPSAPPEQTIDLTAESQAQENNEDGFKRRVLRSVRTIEPIPLPDGETNDIARYMIAWGLATPFTAASTEFDVESGTWRNRMQRIERLFRETRAKAGTEEATGIWHSFNQTAWANTAKAQNMHN